MISSPGVRGQAVQRDRIRRREIKQGIVDAVGGERGAARVGRGLIAHRDPHIGVDRMGPSDGLGGSVWRVAPASGSSS